MTQSFDLDPYERCGPLTSGLPFDAVQPVLGLKVARFRKTPLDIFETLDAGPGLFHVAFDTGGGVSGVEIFTDSTASLTFGGEELLLPDGNAFVAALVRLGQNWEIDDYGIHVPRLGLATFYSDFDWDDGRRKIDAVFVSLDTSYVP